MNLESTAKIAGDWRTIWLSILALFSVAAWAGDTRWITVAEADKIPIQIKLDQLTEDVEELTLEKRFETDPKRKEKLDAYIEYKEKKIESLIKKYNLSQ